MSVFSCKGMHYCTKACMDISDHINSMQESDFCSKAKSICSALFPIMPSSIDLNQNRTYLSLNQIRILEETAEKLKLTKFNRNCCDIYVTGQLYTNNLHGPFASKFEVCKLTKAANEFFFDEVSSLIQSVGISFCAYHLSTAVIAMRANIPRRSFIYESFKALIAISMLMTTAARLNLDDEYTTKLYNTAALAGFVFGVYLPR